jgi:UDP-N-acetylmuramyl pentapeptide synthase
MKIAVLGSMNELGDISQAEHQALGMLCDPTQLAWVVTVGDEAEKYLAPAAKTRGCQVMSFKTAQEAGAFVHKVLEPGAIVLFKGSQGGIYLEEAVKVILHATEDEKQLVRQSAAWLEIKQKFFESVTN